MLGEQFLRADDNAVEAESTPSTYIYISLLHYPRQKCLSYRTKTFTNDMTKCTYRLWDLKTLNSSHQKTGKSESREWTEVSVSILHLGAEH